jgi:inner membrane transporter RhtA
VATRLQTADTETEGHFIDRVPATSYFLTSAVFHYLGPSLAVLLFAHVADLGVMWLRIATAGVVFAVWRRPWRFLRTLNRRQLGLIAALGLVLAVMNSVFYLAVARLPLATVGAIEFLGTVVLATLGVRTWRNLAALAVTVGGVAMLTAVKIGSDPTGFLFAFANCAGFMAYVILGHRVANRERTGSATPGRSGIAGIDQLAAAMLVAAVIATPVGAIDAGPAFVHPTWLLWGAGVGVCSSVVPYITDQLAMARMPRATFALMLALLPAWATAMGAIVLGQVPTVQELCGIGLVVLGLVVHVAPADGEQVSECSSEQPAK